jgi:hypothetical protein
MPSQTMAANTQIVQHNYEDTRGEDVDADAQNAAAEKGNHSGSAIMASFAAGARCADMTHDAYI